jgi:hypothetical protein
MTKRWLEWEHYNVPSHTQDAFEDYIIRGYMPGGFLKAVLENNFTAAACRCDSVNKDHLVPIAKWMSNVAPNMCWGNPAVVQDWLNDQDRVRTLFIERLEKKHMWAALQN